MTKPTERKEPLIDEIEANPDHLTDLLLVIARSVEKSLMYAGAVPGVDYKHLDLYKLAQPYALAVFKMQHQGIRWE
jgi:hypothetical protein